MNLKTNILSLLMLLSSVILSAARQVHDFTIPDKRNTVTINSSEGTGSTWWGYFDGDYSKVIRQGVGGGMPYPLTNNCAIKLERTNPEVLGKRIKAVKFAFMSMDFIEDVKIWMSTFLPLVAEDADICCQSVDLSSLTDTGSNYAANEIYFTEPYQFGGSDIYIGYSFTVTSSNDDLNTYPIAVTDTNTSGNGLFYDWGFGWEDYSGSPFGNLALMVLLDDDAVFALGDTNYDSRVNVGDVSTTVEYILGGNVNPFNNKMADIDGNGNINIVDVASIADIVLGKYESSDSKTVDNGDAVTAKISDCTAEINLSASSEYKAFQMDVVMPADKEITSVDINESLASTHIVRYEHVAGDRYRIVAYSASGECIGCSVDNLLTIRMTSAENVRIENIIFASSDLSEIHFQNVACSDAAGIGQVRSDKRDARIYTINGLKINSAYGELGRGLYVVNGNKILVR